ncbi:hypothetical protein JRQ81_016707 [Phrynocephalus forsythii]|uniref:Uncharacterized protein n=1 Tax=Phrynocephalus forsythii TaxID=171643 RepID=A0A9Q1B154_9SAUR|nr:hypothetical protein JRQ81_016707 [Phrynocephalus forsythii]
MIHFTSNMWTGSHHAYLSLMVHWWQLEDVHGLIMASWEGPQGKAPSQPTGYWVALLPTWSMEDSATGRNFAEELLSVWGWAPEGDVKHVYMVMDAGHNMLATLNTAGLKGIMYMAHKLHLVMCNALGLGSQ